MKRIYGFLAERYLSYWFSRHCKVKEFTNHCERFIRLQIFIIFYKTHRKMEVFDL